MPAFSRFICIDYSGAEAPNASLKGLCVYLAKGDGRPVEVQPRPSSRKYWPRKGIAESLVKRLAEDTRSNRLLAAALCGRSLSRIASR